MSHKQPVKVSNNGSLNGHSQAVKPDSEVVPKAKRRNFSAEYKLRILAEADACTERVWLTLLSRPRVDENKVIDITSSAIVVVAAVAVRMW